MYDRYAAASEDQVRVARFMASLQRDPIDVSAPGSRGLAYRHEVDRLLQKAGELVDNRALRVFAMRVLGEERFALLRFSPRRLLGNFSEAGSAARRFDEVELVLSARLFENSAQLRDAMTRAACAPVTSRRGQRWTFEALLKEIEQRRDGGAVNASRISQELRVSCALIQYACLRANLRLCRKKVGYLGIAAAVIELASAGLSRIEINARLPGIGRHVHAIRIVYADVIEEGWCEQAKRLISSLRATGECTTRRELEDHSATTYRALRTVYKRDPGWLDRVVPRVPPPGWQPPKAEAACSTADWEREVIARTQAKHREIVASGNTRPTLASLSWLAFGEKNRLSALRGRSVTIREFTDALLAPAQSGPAPAGTVPDSTPDGSRARLEAVSAFDARRVLN